MTKKWSLNVCSLSYNRCIFAGLQIFFKNGGPKWPMEQKMVGHFLKWWAQAYQNNHSWHLGSILYLYTDTDSCMHLCILSKTCRKRPLQKEDQLSLNAGQKYCRMLLGAFCKILSTFIKLPFVIKIFILSSFEWLLKTGFTVLTTCMYFLFCGIGTHCKMNIFYWSEIFSKLKRMGPLGPLPWKVMGHILKSWDNDPGPP